MTPTMQQLNHDLALLYAVARLSLPKEVLETLMYGGDFEEPTEDDFNNIKQLVEANKAKRETTKTESESYAIETQTLADGLWKEGD